MNNYYLYMLILTITIHLCSTASLMKEHEECKYISITTVSYVSRCPTSREEWLEAAKKKQCEYLQLFQNCSKPEIFLYHCVIDSKKNQTLEVCAPPRYSQGYCLEFSFFEAKIKDNLNLDCTMYKRTPCPSRYNSTDAYKYQDCYSHTLEVKTTSAPESTNDTNKNSTTCEECTSSEKHQSENVPAVVLGVLFVLVLIALCIGLVYCILTRKLQFHLDKAENRVDGTSSILSSCICCKLKRNSDIQGENGKKIPSTDDIEDDDPDSSRIPLLHVPSQGPSDFSMEPLHMEEKLKQTQTDTKCVADPALLMVKAQTSRDDIEDVLDNYQNISKYFYETNAYDNIRRRLIDNKCVTITGKSGSGKTNTALHLIYKYRINGWKIKKAASTEDFKLIETKEKTLLFIDDLFDGKCEFEELQKWCDALSGIYDMMQQDKTSIQNKEPAEIRVLITARKHVVDDIHEFIGNRCHILKKEFQVDMSSISLSNEEKKEILINQLELAKELKVDDIQDPSTNDIEKILQSESHIGFPVCAYLYAFVKQYRRVELFSDPSPYIRNNLEGIITEDKSKRSEALFAVILMNEIQEKEKKVNLSRPRDCEKCVKMLTKIGEWNCFNLIDVAKRHVGPFLSHGGKDVFKFVHQSVLEAVEMVYLAKYYKSAIPLFPLHAKLKLLQNPCPNSQTTKSYQEHLVEDLKQKIKNGNVSDACREGFFEDNTPFVDVFVNHFQKSSLSDIENVITKDDVESQLQFPIMFWAARCNAQDFIEKMLKTIEQKLPNKDRLKMVFYNYMALFGELTANVSEMALVEMLKDTTIPCVKDSRIKQSLFEFCDDDRNTFLHLLISSDKTDDIIAKYVKDLIDNDKKHVDARDVSERTPLMVAVGHKNKLSVVTSVLLSAGSNMRLFDKTNKTVLHHCICSDKSDSDCEEILKILLQQHKEDGSKLDINARNDSRLTPLMLAVSSLHERKLVVRALLKAGADVKLKDRKGNTVFHHCVSADKNDSKCADMLDILIENRKDFDFNVSNNANETVLNLAAKQTKYSRIICIIKLLEIKNITMIEGNQKLEKKCPQIETFDNSGRSPIYCTVSLLTELTKTMFIERLVRTSIFYIYGDDPHTETDDGKHAIAYCEEKKLNEIVQIFFAGKNRDAEMQDRIANVLAEKLKTEINGHVERTERKHEIQTSKSLTSDALLHVINKLVAMLCDIELSKTNIFSSD